MWHPRQAYCDLPTRSRYTHQQKLLGKDCTQQVLPRATPGKAKNCEDFMANIEEMAAKVIEALTGHKASNPVWLEPLSEVSKHRQATYYVCNVVQKQLSKDTDTLRVGERLFRDRHHSQIKSRF